MLSKDFLYPEASNPCFALVRGIGPVRLSAPSPPHFVGEYGLRNKREVWRVKFTLAKIRKAARELLTLDEKDPRRLFEGVYGSPQERDEGQGCGASDRFSAEQVEPAF